MTLLNQIVAVEAGIKSTTDRAVTDLHHLSQKTQLLTGQVRDYTPKDDEGDRLPSESQPVQLRLDDVLRQLAIEMTRLFDATLTKEAGNTQAVVDLVVDDEPLLTNVPVTYLLFLEKKLVDIATFIAKLPTLDPGVDWTPDISTGDWVADPVVTTRTQKVRRNWVKAEATKEHPAQVEVYHEDVIVGQWTTTKLSGAIPALRKAELADRVRRLQLAVKYAREQANSIEISDRKAGERVFGWLFAS